MRALTNTQRLRLLDLADGPIGHSDEETRAVADLATIGLAHRATAGLEPTLEGWVWLVRALLTDLPALHEGIDAAEARRWETLRHRLAMTDVVYRGSRGDDPSDARVITVETVDGDLLGTMRHVERHSPDGPNWGYAGSGPADCARSLLIAALGDAIAVCSECAGHGTTMTGVSCGFCDGGYTRLPYQTFKNRVVAHLDTDWVLSRDQILAWLDDHLSHTTID